MNVPDEVPKLKRNIGSSAQSNAIEASSPDLSGSVDLLSSKPFTEDPIILGTFFSIAIIFGAIHVAFWNSSIFATTTERALWRATSLAMMTLPAVEAIIVSSVEALDRSTNRLSKGWRRLLQHGIFLSFACGGEIFLPILFILVRLCIIGEIFYNLRSVPKDVYVDVKWANFIPHFSLI